MDEKSWRRTRKRNATSQDTWPTIGSTVSQSAENPRRSKHIQLVNKPRGYRPSTQTRQGTAQATKNSYKPVKSLTQKVRIKTTKRTDFLIGLPGSHQQQSIANGTG